MQKQYSAVFASHIRLTSNSTKTGRDMTKIVESETKISGIKCSELVGHQILGVTSEADKQW